MTVSRPLISVVTPVYMGEDHVGPLVEQVSEVTATITSDFEIVLVDDASPDNAWEQIEKACASDHRVKGVQLSRNFGQHHALTAALEASSGEFVVVMDCDLQDHPKYIPDLFAEISKGYDIVYTRKRKRAHGGLRNWAGAAYTVIFNRLIADAHLKDHKGIGNYSILSRRVVEGFLGMKDRHRHFLGLLRWMGFGHSVIEIDHFERTGDTSSYGFARLAREALIGMTSQSDRLLRWSIFGGFFLVLLSILGAIGLVIQWAAGGVLPGWPSLMVLNTLGFGMVLTSLGIVGIYIGNIFEQAKERPLYLVRKRINMTDNTDESTPIGETQC